MTDLQVRNAFIHRKSFVTRSSLHAVEPHKAAPIILSHESLWIDSELLPNEIPPLVSHGDDVDVANNNSYYNSSGVVVESNKINGERVSVVQKRVRVELTRGNFDEYVSLDDLRMIIHQNYADGYSVVIEYISEGVFEILPNHLWDIQHMAGVITIENNVLSLIPQTLYLTAYFYCGRVGIDKSIKDTTTDDIEEGVSNKFFTRELMLSHLTDLATDNSAHFFISVANSDSLTEGVHNKFFNQENFDNAFNAKSLDDLAPSESARLVTSETMSNLRMSIGGISEIGFDINTIPPNNTNAKLYVERGTAGENVLYFEDKPIGATTVDPVPAPPTQADPLGNFTGHFEGSTKGVHTGDVIGNVKGFVSDLGNHPIIEAKLLGNGEGHWVGTVNGDVVGKFEGHAKIVTGSIDNASHVTVGTFDSTASLHVKSNDKHVQISNTDGSSVLIECRAASRMAVSCSVLETTTLACKSIDCSQTLTVNELNTNNIKCVGLTNSFYGIFETGRIEDVSEIVGERGSLSLCNTGIMQTLLLSCANATTSHARCIEGVFDSISCNNSMLENIKSNNISVSNFHVENLSFDTSVFLENPNIIFNTLSVSEITSNFLSLGDVHLNNITVHSGALIPNVFSQHIQSDMVTTQVLSISELYYPSDFAINVRSLSVQMFYCDDGTVDTLSANAIFYDMCDSETTKTSSLEATTINTNDIVTMTLSASSIDCSSIDVSFMSAQSVQMVECNTSNLSSAYLTSPAAQILRLSCSNIHSEHLYVSDLEAARVNIHRSSVEQLSTQSFFSQSVIVDESIFNKISASHLTLDFMSSHSTSSFHTEINDLKSNVHLSNELSVNSSYTFLSNVETLSVNNLYTNRLKSSYLSTGSLLTGLSLVQQNISCGESITASNVNASTIHSEIVDSTIVNSRLLSTHSLYSDRSLLGLLSVSNATFQNAFSSRLSCSAFNCDDITAPRANFDILSVNSIVGVHVTLSNGGVTQEFVTNYVDNRLSSVNQSIDTALSLAFLQDINHLNSLSCSAGRIDTLTSDTILMDQVQGNKLSVSEITATSLSIATLHGIVLTQQLSVTGLITHLSTSSVTTADLSVSEMTASEMTASEITVSSLSVATLHGIVLAQQLSVTGMVDHISTSTVTTSNISCGTLFIDNIIRSVPHISDTATPAVLTSSTVGDFALFSEDSKHSGDMVIEGSLYVTDTIFMGIEPSLNIENVQNMIASRISVGELTVDILTGIGGGPLANLLSVSPHDTVHEGNMQIDGNLVVSGVVMTGAHNKLIPNHGSFEMDGTLSVSGDVVSNGINIVETLLSIQHKLDSLL